MTSDNKYLNSLIPHPLQTLEWGEFRKAWGNYITRISAGQIIYSKIPHTKYKIGTLIRGKAPNENDIGEIKKDARNQNAVFVKLEPNCNNKNCGQKEFKNKRDILAKHAMSGRKLFTPETFWIDLTKSEDELMKSFSSKTRYNIRLAERKGVKIKEDNTTKAFEKYLTLTFETAKRQGFYAHSKKYHKLMWKHLHVDMVKKGNEPIARLLTAVYKNQILTAWIVFVWKDFIYYPYGASSNQYRNVMANNLIMWEAIKYGKKLKLKTFDLWGKEEGKGFTKFKEGYNPEIVEFIGSWDLVINKPIYFLYRLAEDIRWFFLKKLLPFFR